MRVVEEHALVFCFRKDLPVEFRSHRETGANVDSRLVNRIGCQDLSGRYGYGIKAEERIETRHNGGRRLREFLIPVENATATSDVKVDVALWVEVNDRIERCRKYVHGAIGNADVIQCRPIDAE